MLCKSSIISLSASYLAAVACAHFVLTLPTSLGYDDSLETSAPCGSFNPTDRTKGVTTWPIGGSAISVITTHSSVTWDFKAALVSNTSNWVRLTPVLSQTGIGYFCEPGIPGIAAWIGLPVVLQVIQHAVDGALYQCAAINFVAGGAAATPSGCLNSTGITAHW